jgi:thymidylate kinase
MKDHLGAGGNVIIFPEGTRGEPGRMERFRTGVGRLAEAFREVPTVPVFLSGPEKAFPKDASFPIPIWNQVTVGPPQLFHGSTVDFTRALEGRILELSRSRTADRHRRIKRPRKAFTVAVLGIDGSGKSTVSRRIARRLPGGPRTCLVSDRLEFFEEGERRSVHLLPSERVRQVLGMYAKSARSLKHYKIPKLAELLLRDHLMGEVQRWYAPEVQVLDGSPLINLTAWAKLYKGDLMTREVCIAAMRILTGEGEAGKGNDPALRRLPELAALRRLGLTRLKLADIVLWLDVDPAVSMERIRTRGGKIQVHETEEKLGRLREGYRMVCDVVRSRFGLPVRILDGGEALEDVVRQAISAVDDVWSREEEADA